MDKMLGGISSGNLWPKRVTTVNSNILCILQLLEAIFLTFLPPKK